MIVVFGSLNADLVFRVPSLPRPGETVLAPDYTVVAGGKGANQAYAAARAGAPTRMAGCVGDDEFGHVLLSSLSGAGVDTQGVLHRETRTGCAAIAVDAAGENQIAVAAGANQEARAAQVPDDWLTPDTVLVLQMEVPAAENWALIARAKQAGGRVVLNVAPAAPVPPSVLEFVDVLIVNQTEAMVVAEAAGVPETDPIRAIRSLARGFGMTTVVTLGADGAFACVGDEEWEVPPLKISPADTTGAGDAFCGVLAAALDAGLAFTEALRRAGTAGALACTRAGAQTAMADAADIEARLPEAPPVRRATSKRGNRHEA
ncbi:ribokinase [Shumkonia mesophila]|uniref:ribokinase n=1 Tax=Shumkonia mesophila TaxID=2838854 RepID=UPI002934D8E0|nr:ribokinase [Shumkonia mesophila]